LSDTLEGAGGSGDSVGKASEELTSVSFEGARKLDMTKLGNGKGKRSQKRRTSERRKEHDRSQQVPEGDEKERAKQDCKVPKSKLRQGVRRRSRKRWLEEQTERAGF